MTRAQPDATSVSDTPRPDPSGLPAAVPFGMLRGMATDAAAHPVRTALGFVPGVGEGLALQDAAQATRDGHPVLGAFMLAAGVLPGARGAVHGAMEGAMHGATREATQEAGATLRAALAQSAQRDAGALARRILPDAPTYAGPLPLHAAPAAAEPLVGDALRAALERASARDASALPRRLGAR